ncbi:MAG: HAD family hydrolase [Gemmatimonadota bacterium]
MNTDIEPEGSDAVRIAMWSGPRNISTALMRSWGSRPDTYVCDEPLYAFYLLATGRDHPGRAEILREHDTDPDRVITWLTGRVPEGKRIFYQKQMAHHLLPGVERDWLSDVRHGFLIREPREMLTSLIRVTPDPCLDDTGLPQQWKLFERAAAETGSSPPVIDARDVLEDPAGLLVALCGALDVPFMECMLSWEPGPRPTDGVWAKHWYASAEASTAFRPYRPKPDRVPAGLQGLLDECRPIYDRLYAERLTA